MSDYRASESVDMWRETEEFSLTKAVEDVGQHSYTQTQALKEKEKTLSMLQATLSNVEKKAETAEQELRSKAGGNPHTGGRGGSCRAADKSPA
ncbi:hypothetical protein E3U43_018988 [Larimichthys crocea]|uniref:Uncharacterized protein n=1 Tax=Larimichthys crocea TaxID=215358 RepID=A0ACD3QWY6_LARCR|nr:hypothetical protein E3U43_018988 [Larimichthys crocea]